MLYKGTRYCYNLWNYNDLGGQLGRVKSRHMGNKPDFLVALSFLVLHMFPHCVPNESVGKDGNNPQDL